MSNYYRVNLKNKKGETIYPNLHDQWTIDENGKLTMTEGMIVMPHNKYYENNNYALNMNNSDIIKLNSMYFCDTSDSGKEGIHFYRDGEKWDSLWMNDGELKATINRPITSGNGTELHVFSWNGQGAKKTQYRQTIDLSGSQYDVDTYYPVTARLDKSGYTRMRIFIELNSNKPSWSTHANGFSCHADIHAVAAGWGTTGAETFCTAYTYKHTSKNPIGGYKQGSQDSWACFYLRGGGKYPIYSSEPLSWIIRTEEFSNSTDIFAPTTTPPGLTINRAIIYANINGQINKVTNSSFGNGVWWSVIFGDAAEVNEGIYTHTAKDNFRYYQLNGTTSAAGRNLLALGNSIAEGTADNAYGEIRLYSHNTGYNTLLAANNANNFTNYIPASNGTLINTNGGTISGTLTITGGTDAAGTASNNVPLSIGARSGAHLELDGNEIMAKTNGTSVADLYINNDGGIVYIGSGGVAPATTNAHNLGNSSHRWSTLFANHMKFTGQSYSWNSICNAGKGFNEGVSVITQTTYAGWFPVIGIRGKDKDIWQVGVYNNDFIIGRLATDSTTNSLTASYYFTASGHANFGGRRVITNATGVNFLRAGTIATWNSNYSSYDNGTIMFCW